MKDKDFDCVEMKLQIQANLMEKMQDLPWEEYCQKTEDTIKANPQLRPILESANIDTPAARIAPTAHTG